MDSLILQSIGSNYVQGHYESLSRILRTETRATSYYSSTPNKLKIVK